MPPAPPPAKPAEEENNPLRGLPGYSQSTQPTRGSSTSSLREELPGRDYRFIKAQIVDPKTDRKPITIRVQGNQIIIESEDTDALDIIMGIARSFTPGTPPIENLFKTIKLKNVVAADAAKTISEIFNGPQQSQQPGRGGLGGLFGGGGGLLGGLLGGGAPSTPSGINPNRVRVVAEPISNSLIVVKATPIDLLTIESLLSNYIDKGVTEDSVTLKHWVIPIRNADVSEIVLQVKDLYKAAMDTGNSGGGNRGGFPFPFGPQQQQQSPAKPPALSVTADDRSNSLILYCSEAMKNDVEELVRQIDTRPTATTEVVQLVKLKGIDPALVQQAVNAVQGISPQQPGGRGGFGGGGFGGFGGQGGERSAASAALVAVAAAEAWVAAALGAVALAVEADRGGGGGGGRGGGGNRGGGRGRARPSTSERRAP